MRIKIIKSPWGGEWYKSMIGEEFEVVKTRRGKYYVNVYEYSINSKELIRTRAIWCSDAKVID